MRHTQRGVTFIGWLFLLIPLAIVVYAGIRLTPLYLNYFRVSKGLSELASENRGTEVTAISADALRGSLGKHFDVGYVDHPDPKDMDIHREGSHWVVIAEYTDSAPLFSNISISVDFYKQVTIE